MRLHDLRGIVVVVCLGVALALVGPAAAWAASEGGHEGGLISLDKSLIVQAINFLILLFILKRLLESAKAQMDADVRRAREELRREVADLATAVAEKLVRRSLRDEDHRRIVAEAITKVGN